MPASIQDDLVVAEAFSAIHRGAALLFNLLIAEAREEESRQDDYRTQLEHWQTSAAQTLESFDLARVWAMAPASSRRAREFIVAWRAAARRSAGGSVAESGAARELVADRELRVKGTRRSRIANPQRVPWNGASGSAQLDFRWGASVQRLTLDVAEGRDRA
jgi:hypothetical protein